MKKLFILLAVCTWEYAAAQDQNQSSNAAMAQTTVSADTSVSNFLIEAAKADMMEIKAGQIATQRALNPQVKSYAEMIVRDHSKSSSDVKNLADRKNVQLPASVMSTSGTANLGTGASTSRNMGVYGQSADWGDAVMRHDPGTPETWRSYNSKNTTRSTEGTATYWTPSHRGRVGISNRSAGTSYGTPSRNTMGATGRSTSADASQADVSGTNTVDRTSVSGGINTDVEIPEDLDTEVHGTVSDNRSSVNGDVRADASASANVNNGTAGVGTSMSGTMGATGTDHQQKLNSLMQKAGSEFDREYMNMMTTDHTNAIRLYESAASSSDADIRAFADRMLPILRQHQNSAKSILNTLKNSDNSSL